MTAAIAEPISRSDWADLRRWYRENGRHDLPWRSDLDPWRILLAETLLHRTRASQVVELYRRAIREFPSPRSVVDRPELWLELTRSAGLTWRAQKFLQACQILIDRYRGTVPDSRQALLALPGIGHYVADAILTFGFGHPGVIVDTNTIRIAGRVLGRELKVESHRTLATRAAVSLLSCNDGPLDPDDNWALLDLAAAVCLARMPRCGVCPLRSACSTGNTRNGAGIRA